MKPTFTWPVASLLLLAGACMADVDGSASENDDTPMQPGDSLVGTGSIASVNKSPRYTAIKNAATARGLRSGYLLAGIANDETGLAQCWSEATWACQGPASPDCGSGPVIAGSADGPPNNPCGPQQGGLGMFQFDAGTYSQTLAHYGNSILTVDGQLAAAIDYAVWMVKISPYTTNAETDAKARAWIDNFDPGNAALRDQWIRTVVRYYNGCQPGWSCWGPRYQTYSDGYFAAINEPGGLGFWSAPSGTSCAGSPATVGLIDEKYRALGGCDSVVGHPISEELGTPDGIGRYSVFERGSIYWTAATGAFEVHGVIRDKYRDLGWEAGALGYPTSDEYAVAGGRRSDFQHGFITWTSSTNTATATYP